MKQSNTSEQTGDQFQVHNWPPILVAGVGSAAAAVGTVAGTLSAPKMQLEEVQRQTQQQQQEQQQLQQQGKSKKKKRKHSFDSIFDGKLVALLLALPFAAWQGQK